MKGFCRICGEERVLTKEHVPPRATGNTHSGKIAGFWELLEAGLADPEKSQTFQGGVKFTSLCMECNTGRTNKYNQELIAWYSFFDHQLRRALEEHGTSIQTLRFDMTRVSPLCLIKGIVCMFLSTNNEQFRRSTVGSELAAFVYEPETIGLPADVRIYMYLNHEGRYRYSPTGFQMNVLSGRSGWFSEITKPPLGFVMATDGDPLEPRLCEITNLADVPFNTKTDCTLILSVLPTHLQLALDYRTELQIERDAELNDRLSIDAEPI